jgi:hypothetical protein
VIAASRGVIDGRGFRFGHIGRLRPRPHLRPQGARVRLLAYRV